MVKKRSDGDGGRKGRGGGGGWRNERRTINNM